MNSPQQLLNGKPSFSVVIATYCRSTLVGRAIQSVLDQKWPDVEVIVVDDASPDDTESVIRSNYPQVRYFRQDCNQGPGPARQRGISEAKCQWVAVLDDDDYLDENALQSIAEKIAGWRESNNYPVLMFAHENGVMKLPFKVMRIEDFCGGSFRGDFLEVVQRDFFLSAGYGYPKTRLGSESMLWMSVAERYGIPMWRRRVAKLGEDAASRLTSVKQQIKHAKEHALLQEMYLATYEDRLKHIRPDYIDKRHLGAATYWLLAGNPGRASVHIQYLLSHNQKCKALGLRLLSLAPTALLRGAFTAFRWINQKQGRTSVQT